MSEKVRLLFSLESCKNSNSRGSVEKFFLKLNQTWFRRLEFFLYNEPLKFAVRFFFNHFIERQKIQEISRRFIHLKGFNLPNESSCEKNFLKCFYTRWIFEKKHLHDVKSFFKKKKKKKKEKVIAVKIEIIALHSKMKSNESLHELCQFKLSPIFRPHWCNYAPRCDFSKLSYKSSKNVSPEIFWSEVVKWIKIGRLINHRNWWKFPWQTNYRVIDFSGIGQFDENTIEREREREREWQVGSSRYRGKQSCSRAIVFEIARAMDGNRAFRSFPRFMRITCVNNLTNLWHVRIPSEENSPFPRMSFILSDARGKCPVLGRTALRCVTPIVWASNWRLNFQTSHQLSAFCKFLWICWSNRSRYSIAGKVNSLLLKEQQGRPKVSFLI